MKKAMKNVFLVLGLATMFSGCFAGGYHYEPPNLTPPDISECTIEINRNIDAVWRAIILVVNDIDLNILRWHSGSKDLHLVYLSFRTHNPTDYCDCGKVQTYIKNAKVRRDYNFPAASKNQLYEFVNEGQLIKVQREVFLSGEVKITLHELLNDHTKVKVMIKYVLTKNTTVVNDVAETIPSTHLPSKNYFTSTTLGTDSNQIICRSTLALEKSILHKINEYTNKYINR